MEAVFVSHEWWVQPLQNEANTDERGHPGTRASGYPDCQDGHEQAHLKYDLICNGMLSLIMSGSVDVAKPTLLWMDCAWARL